MLAPWASCALHHGQFYPRSSGKRHRGRLAASQQRSSYRVVCLTLENIDFPCSLSMSRRIAAGGLATKL
jgi:hypothetical protein